MSPNNEHAARLREMARFEQAESTEWIECIKKLQDPPPSETARCFIRSYTEYAEQNERKAAALLAGAEALEKSEELRAVVRDFQRMYCGFGMKTEAEALNDRATAALARLEGK
jgi:hypothetical protein